MTRAEKAKASGARHSSKAGHGEVIWGEEKPLNCLDDWALHMVCSPKGGQQTALSLGAQGK